MISTRCVYKKNDTTTTTTTNNNNTFIVIKNVLYSLIKSTYINYRVP